MGFSTSHCYTLLRRATLRKLYPIKSNPPSTTKPHFALAKEQSNTRAWSGDQSQLLLAVHVFSVKPCSEPLYVLRFQPESIVALQSIATNPLVSHMSLYHNFNMAKCGLVHCTFVEATCSLPAFQLTCTVCSHHLPRAVSMFVVVRALHRQGASLGRIGPNATPGASARRARQTVEATVEPRSTGTLIAADAKLHIRLQTISPRMQLLMEHFTCPRCLIVYLPHHPKHQ